MTLNQYTVGVNGYALVYGYNYVNNSERELFLVTDTQIGLLGEKYSLALDDGSAFNSYNLMCWNYFEAVVYNLGDLMYLSRLKLLTLFNLIRFN